MFSTLHLASNLSTLVSGLQAKNVGGVQLNIIELIYASYPKIVAALTMVSNWFCGETKASFVALRDSDASAALQLSVLIAMQETVLANAPITMAHKKSIVDATEKLMATKEFKRFADSLVSDCKNLKKSPQVASYTSTANAQSCSNAGTIGVLLFLTIGNRIFSDPHLSKCVQSLSE